MAISSWTTTTTTSSEQSGYFTKREETSGPKHQKAMAIGIVGALKNIYNTRPISVMRVDVINIVKCLRSYLGENPGNNYISDFIRNNGSSDLAAYIFENYNMDNIRHEANSLSLKIKGHEMRIPARNTIKEQDSDEFFSNLEELEEAKRIEQIRSKNSKKEEQKVLLEETSLDDVLMWGRIGIDKEKVAKDVIVKMKDSPYYDFEENSSDHSEDHEEDYEDSDEHEEDLVIPNENPASEIPLSNMDTITGSHITYKVSDDSWTWTVPVPDTINTGINNDDNLPL